MNNVEGSSVRRGPENWVQDGGLSTCVLPEGEESRLQGWVPSLGSEHGGGVGQGNIRAQRGWSGIG